MSRPGSKSGKPGLFMTGHEFISPFGIALGSAVRRPRVPTLLVCREAIRVLLVWRRIPAEITLLI
jgi:hypothetical protein